MALVKEEIRDRSKTAAEGFLEGWKKSNSRKMYKHCQKTWKKNHRRRLLKHWLPINSYQILFVHRKGNALCDVRAMVKFQGEKRIISMNVISERKAYNPDIVKGEPGVNPISIRW